MPESTDLLASGELIKLLEQAKSETEFTLDDFPGLFGVVDARGTLYKGNRNLAELLEVAHEELIGQSIRKLFSEADWSRIVSHLAADMDSQPNFEFALSTVDPNSGHSYTWKLRIFGQALRKNPLFVMVGSDVSQLKALTSHNTRMEMELHTANRLQDMMLPPLDHKTEGLSLTGIYASATECGGDWWYYARDKDQFSLWLGDVTGHGVPAALLTTFARSAVTVLQRRGETSLRTSLELLNELIYEIARREKLMTVFAAQIDLKTGMMEYYNAGHEPVYMFSEKDTPNREIHLINTRPSSPLGFSRKGSFESGTAKLEKGDRILFYTDGVWETDLAQEKFKGSPKRFQKSLTEFSQTTANIQELKDLIQVETLGNQKDLIDDYTLLIAEYTGI